MAPLYSGIFASKHCSYPVYHTSHIHNQNELGCTLLSPMYAAYDLSPNSFNLGHAIIFRIPCKIAGAV